MRVRVITSPPLPELKAWFSLATLAEDASVTILKDKLCKTLQALRDAGVCGQDTILSLDDFELLDESRIDILRDGDLICIRTRLNVSKRKAAPGPDSPRKKLKPLAQDSPVRSTDRGLRTKSNKTAVSSTSSSEVSSEESSSSDSSDSTSESDSDSDSSSDSAPDQVPSGLPKISSNKQSVSAVVSQRPIPTQHPPLVPPGQGKPGTKNRNLRRRKKRQYESDTAPNPISAVASSENAIPLGSGAVQSAPDTYSSEPAIAMMSLSNKNKRRGFKRAMAGQVPQRIVFDDITDSGVASPQLSTPPLHPQAENSGSPPKPNGFPLLIPPSQKQEMGLLPPNILVTSVDVEADLWPQRKGRRKAVPITMLDTASSDIHKGGEYQDTRDSGSAINWADIDSSMLPQVANHIIHHTARAAAAAQSQAGQTLRNVLGLQSSGTQSASTGLNGWNATGSSSWGSGHTGAGGAKYHTGSRFYSGYTGPGRAITQANASSADADANETDDDESIPTLYTLRSTKKPRNRSHSLSVGAHGRPDSRDNVRVLEAIRLYARSRHAFAASHLLEAAKDSSADTRVAGKPRLTRRNSTSSSVSLSSSGEPVPNDVFTAPSAPVHPSFGSSDPGAPQSVLPPEPSSIKDQTDADDSYTLQLFNELKHARDRRDPGLVRAALAKLQSTEQKANIANWNMALEALTAIRSAGEPVSEVLSAYNTMVKRSLIPNIRTYGVLIDVLVDRDAEVHSRINIIRRSIDQRRTLGVTDSPDTFADEQRIAALQAENNFASAMSLFYAATSLQHAPLHVAYYMALLRSCALHKDVDSAIRVFADFEKRFGESDIPAPIYGNLIWAYSSAGDVEGATVVFDEFQRVSQLGKVRWPRDADRGRIGHIQVWDRMIEAYVNAGNSTSALGLLERMLDTPSGELFGPQDVPAPALTTYRVIIEGFIRNGDMVTALSWLERMADQGVFVEDPWLPTITPPHPDRQAFSTVLMALADAGMVNDMNRVFLLMSKVAVKDGFKFDRRLRVVVFQANIRYLENAHLDSAKVTEKLNWLSKVLGHRSSWDDLLKDIDGYNAIAKLVGLYAANGRSDKALGLIEQIPEYSKQSDTSRQYATLAEIPELVQVLSDALLLDNGVPRSLPLGSSLRLAQIWLSHGLEFTMPLIHSCLTSYDQAKERGTLGNLTTPEWHTLGYIVNLHGVLADLPQLASAERSETFLADLAHFRIDPSNLSIHVVDGLVRSVLDVKGLEETTQILSSLGPSFETLLSRQAIVPPEVESDVAGTDSAAVETSPTGNVQIDEYHGRFVDNYNMFNDPRSPLEAYSRFISGSQLGLYPSPDVISRLIESLGRMKEMEKVFTVYEGAQAVLASLEYDKAVQTAGWAEVENAMVIALAHAGDGVCADIHRVRLLESGANLTADAYGGLIQCIKETTDDTARAMFYFEESQMRGVKPNIYLYNTAISKLAKARKADFAIDLFHRMQAEGIRPSSVTYGAVIAACCRVGDSQSAETLFEEMASQPNFKPRVPPYNTMMQFYVQTKPNRPRVLHYYSAMRRAGIKPTAHTYKLLIDAHGCIEPVDFNAVESTFAELVKNRNIPVQGSHWAAMINAYGCVAKNLEKAAAVFESIFSHPSTVTATHSHPLPDAVTYEAMINVLVTLRRTDLIPQYIERLQKSGVHMTAYIANLLIRGYAAAGDIEKARDVFEGLVDPPVGVAAPNNHAPHDLSSSASSVSPNAPIYREPSTWEAMVRAELGNGNREQAVALLERVLARHYPESIYNRISGIMLDDSVSPWPSEPSSSGAGSP
ncbi:hypothetical protein EWM64_g753 [Hericium alpestre]|uniref:Pentatricopeptide repeat-containing protein-mitochondrial domain-containing protein n=1 Tax=Hericium alpestre TaxID=135208 RepID=A0A4Z0AC90_9AGAM|nr:hypothetical protein EWM64_g753 [Hericium alpestre]